MLNTSKNLYTIKNLLLLCIPEYLYTMFAFKITSTGFIPDEDQGVLISQITLPDGASLPRTEEVTRRFINEVGDLDGVDTQKVTAFGGDGVR